MLENRSFDNFLGSLYPNSAQFEGLKLHGSMYNTHGGQPYPVSNTSSLANPFATPTPDPGESFPDMNLQIFNNPNPPEGTAANMAGFVNDWMARFEEYPDIPTGKACWFLPEALVHWPALPRTPAPSPGDIMFYYTPSQVSVSSVLAKSFGVSDSWFGSCPTQTYPNRYFVNCGTSGGYVNDVDYLNNLEIWPNVPSIFELLDGTGGYSAENWKVYFHDFSIAQLIKYVLKAPRGMVCNFDNSDFAGDSKTPTFADDVQNQTLPKYCFIEPRYGGINDLPPNDNHPPFDIRNGEILVGTIYNLLRGSKYYWPRTLLIITYDEHGGCYDHVIPPPAVAPGGTVLRNPSSFGFNRFGPRVPAILVSPYIPAGAVVRPAGFSYVQGSGTSTTNGVTPFDHTSVIRTVVECFSLQSGGQLANLTQRDLVAPGLADALSLDSTNLNNGPASVTLPDPPPVETAPSGVVPDFHLSAIFLAICKKLASIL